MYSSLRHHCIHLQFYMCIQLARVASRQRPDFGNHPFLLFFFLFWKALFSTLSVASGRSIMRNLLLRRGRSRDVISCFPVPLTFVGLSLGPEVKAFLSAVIQPPFLPISLTYLLATLLYNWCFLLKTQQDHFLPVPAYAKTEVLYDWSLNGVD